MSSRSENEWVSISDLISTDSSSKSQQHSISPPPLPPRNSRSVTQSLTGFPGHTSKVQRLCQHLRHISCTDSESDDNITKEGPKSPIGTIPHAVQPELGVPEYSEPSVAILDPGGLWPHLEPSIKAHMPLKSLELVNPITKSNVIINELPIKLSVHESIESLQETWKEASIKAWNWYKAPFAVVYVVTADNQDYYRNHVRPKIRQFLDLQDSESLMKEGWLILYVNVTSGQAPLPEKGIDAVHSKIFGLISANFYVKSPGDRSCFVSVCKDDSEEEKQQQPEQQQQHLEDYNLNKHWNSIVMQIGTVIVDTFNARVQMYETDLSLLEEKRMDPGWDFSQFFLVNDALALMYRQLGLINDALLKYQELAASVIVLSNEAQKTMERQKVVESEPSTDLRPGDAPAVEEDPEFGRLLFGLPSQCIPQPHPVFDLHSMAFRKRLLSRTLHSAVLEAQLYLFAREIQLLLETCSPFEMVGCAFSFIPAYCCQLLLRTDIVPAHIELWALKASWDIVKLYSAMYQCCHEQLSQPRPSNSTETEYSEKGGGGGNNGGGMYETVVKDKDTSAEICDLLLFMIDRLMECVSKLSSFDCLSKSPVWEIYECGFWINAQTWTPAFEQLQLEPILSPPSNAQSTTTIISEELLFWDSDEGGEVEQFNFTEIEKSEVLPNPMRTLSSFPMIILQSTDIFDNSERRELDNHLLEIYSSKDGKVTSIPSVDFESLGSSRETSFQCPTDADSENKDGQQQSYCKGLETANDLDLVYLQITYSLVKYLMKAKKFRTAAVIQQRRCDVLLSHGKWPAVIRLLEGHAYPQDIGWHLLEFHRLQRLAQCYWNMGLMDSFIGTVLRMCSAYKGATTTMELASSLKGLLTSYIETCSSVLLTTSVNLNPSETNLTCIATPELLFGGGNSGMDDDVRAGDEFMITCNVLSHLPSQIKICPLPVLTLKVLDMSSSSSKRGGGMEKGGGGAAAAICVVEYIVQHEHSSKV